MNVLQSAILVWALALAALLLMVMAHAPKKSVAEILHDAEEQ
jgi:hypothetical protein